MALALLEGKAHARRGEGEVEKKSIAQVLKEHTPELMSVPGVAGTGEGRYKGKPCVEVYVVKKTPELGRRIPASLDGYPVVVKETGRIRSLPEKPGK